MLDNIFKNQNGSTMAISVLIMSIMSIVVFSLSNVVLKQIDLSRNFDNSLLAYYGAESGIEEGIFDVRKLDLAKSQSNGEFLNGVIWNRVVIPTKEEVVFKKIERNKFVQLDLFDQDDPSCGSGDENGVYCNWESMSLQWEGDATLDLQITTWTPTSAIDYEAQNKKEVKYILATSPLILNDLEFFKLHRIKIKSLFDDIQNLKVVLYSEDDKNGKIVPIPNFLTIKSTGKSRLNKSSLLVEILRKTPLSSLYDYVIFSEDDITKEASKL